jgi:hypothetical protein
MKTHTIHTNNRLTNYLTAAVSAGTLASTASAAIVTFSDSGSFIEGTVDDGDQPTITIPLAGGENLFIDPYGGARWLSLAFNNDFFARTTTNGRFTGAAGTGYSVSYPRINLLSYGDAIYANNSGDNPFAAGLVNNGIPQADFVGDVSGYIGFITPLGNKGWIDVGYNSTTGLFRYNGGAVGTGGTNLTAGQVPEPSTAVLSLGALAAGAFIRRRKQAA